MSVTEFNHAIDRCGGHCKLGEMPLAAVQRKIIEWFLEWPFGPDDGVDDRIHAFDAFFKGVTSTLFLTGHRHLCHAICDLKGDIERTCHGNTFLGDLSILNIIDLRAKAAAGDKEAIRHLDKVAAEFGQLRAATVIPLRSVPGGRA